MRTPLVAFGNGERTILSGTTCAVGVQSGVRSIYQRISLKNFDFGAAIPIAARAAPKRNADRRVFDHHAYNEIKIAMTVPRLPCYAIGFLAP
jgi:hypothetical protein